jgi:hypothetical protein
MAVERPKLVPATRGLDFGEGFYLTSSDKQAKKFAFNVCKRAERLNQDNIGEPTINVFEFDLEANISELSVLTFGKATFEWLTFVRENRLRQYSGRAYDLIIGPVANDNVFTTLQLLVNGDFDISAAIAALKTDKLADQYCFASQKAVDLLNHKESVVLGEGE